jgi:hypothetical protein
MTFVQHHAFIAGCFKNKSLKHESSANISNTSFCTNTLTLQHDSSVSYVMQVSRIVRPTEYRLITAVLRGTWPKHSAFLYLPWIKHETNLRRLLNTKDNNVFWKTGKVLRICLHAMYSTYEEKYHFTPVYNVMINGLLYLYCCIEKPTETSPGTRLMHFII